MKKDEMKVKVYMDFINYWGETTDSYIIGQFPHMGWAERFIEEAKESEDNLTKIRVEIKK